MGTQLAFYVPTEFVLKSATCRYKGTHCYIFVEESQWDIIAAQPKMWISWVRFLTRRLRLIPSAEIFEIAVDAFGEPADEDGDPRIFILILDLPSNIVGYFDGELYEAGCSPNSDAIRFTSTRTSWPFSAYLAHATLAHEFQHLIHWGRDSDEERMDRRRAFWVCRGASRFPRGRSEHGAEFSRGSQYQSSALGF